MGYQDLISKLNSLINCNKNNDGYIETLGITGDNYIEKITLLKHVLENVYLCFNKDDLIVGIYDTKIKKFIPCHQTSYIIENNVIVFKNTKKFSDDRDSYKDFPVLNRIYFSLYNALNGEYIKDNNFYSEVAYSSIPKNMDLNYNHNGLRIKKGVIFLGSDENQVRLIYDTMTNTKYWNFKFYDVREPIVKLYNKEKEVGEELTHVFDFSSRKIYPCYPVYKDDLKVIFKSFYYYIKDGRKIYFHENFKSEYKRFSNYNIVYLYNEDNEIKVTFLFDDSFRFTRKYLGEVKELLPSKIEIKDFSYDRFYLFDSELYVLDDTYFKSSEYPFVKYSSLQKTTEKTRNYYSIFSSDELKIYGVKDEEDDKLVIYCEYKIQDRENNFQVQKEILGRYDSYTIRNNFLYLYQKEQLDSIYDLDDKKLRKCFRLPIKDSYSYKLENLYFAYGLGLKLINLDNNFDYYYKKIGEFTALVLKEDNEVIATILFKDDFSFAKVFLGEIIELSNEIKKELGISLLERVYYLPRFKNLCYLKDINIETNDSLSMYLSPFVEIPFTYENIDNLLDLRKK